MFHRLSLTPVPEFAKRVSAKHRSDARCSLPMNRSRKLLEMNECSKTGSWAQGAIKVRGDLSLRQRDRVRGNAVANSQSLAYSRDSSARLTMPGPPRKAWHASSNLSHQV